MKVVSSDCIILSNQDYREQDRLVKFLARDKGHMSGIARGARKLTARGVSTFEPLMRGTIFYVEKANGGLVAIRKCDPVPPYLMLDADYDKLLYASYMAELIGLCSIQPTEAEAMFLLLASGLQSLHENQSPDNLRLLRLDFELDILELLGVQPEWRRCVSCERPLFGGGRLPRPLLTGRHQFDLGLGGVRCPDCRVEGGLSIGLSAGSLAFLAAWRGGGARGNVRPTRNALAELENAVTRHLVHQLEREPRSLALLPANRPAG